MTILTQKHPDLIKEWHDYLNLPRTPDKNIIRKKDKIWWLCKENKNHIFSTTLESKLGSRSGGCPYCSGKKVLPDESLSKTHREIAAEWHLKKNSNEYPYEYSYGSTKKKWWKCGEGEDHEWEASIQSRTLKKARDSNCPCCANRQLSVTNSLEVKNPKLAKQFNAEKNKMNACDVIASRKSNGNKKMWWICSENPNHEWLQNVAVCHNQNSGCPHCKNKWESQTTKIIEEIISRNAKASIKSQHKLGKFFFDVRIDLERNARAEGEFLIELDGEQHYKDMPHWGHLLREQHLTDTKKTNLAKEKNFIFGRIPYWVKTKKAIEEEFFNILGKDPTYSDVPNDQKKKIQPDLSISGKKWKKFFEG